MRYFSPNEIPINGQYDLVGAAILVGMTLVLFGCSQIWFVHRDI